MDAGRGIPSGRTSDEVRSQHTKKEESLVGLRLSALGLLLSFAAGATHGATLDLTPLHRDLRFNFGNPGARALGMGGAFIGRADDASAAEANPAGLTAIADPEFTVELRSSRYRAAYATGLLNAAAPLGQTNVGNTTSGLSFASFAIPWRNFAFAGYYHEPLRYEQRGTTDRTAGSMYLRDGVPSVIGEYPGDFGIDYTSRTYGLGAAWHWKKLSLGATARYQTLSPRSFYNSYDVDYSTPDFHRKPTLIFGYTSDEGQSAMAYSAGFKWSSKYSRFNVGGVYKSGASFRITECFTDVEFGLPADCLSQRLHAPDQLGVGVSVMPKANIPVMLSADVVRVRYSNLMEGWNEVFSPCVVDPGPCVGQTASSIGYDIPDATEVHLGAEWIIGNFRKHSVPFVVRAGWWRDPEHSIRFRGTSLRPDDPRLASEWDALIRFTEEKYRSGIGAENHYTVGISYVGNSFDINAAYDHARHARVAAVSVVKRFKRS
jgi:hypothetical protein